MSKPTRREFLKSAVLGTVGTGMALTVFNTEGLPADPQASVDRRAFTAGRFALEIDGIMAGWLHSAEGGHATGDVVIQKSGAGSLPEKRPGNVKYENITLTCGTGMSRGFYEWISATLARAHARKSGAIVTYDYDYKEISRLEWNSALITEVGFPALDAASKDAAKMTIKFSPEFTRMSKQPGGKMAFASSARVQKKWLPSNFRLEIPGLDCTRVNKIEALVVKQKVVDNPVGRTQDYQKEGANVEVPNLVITVPETSAAGFYNWHKEFVTSGANSKNNRKTGQLDYLTEDLREALFTLNFRKLGIFKVMPDKVESHSENIRRVKAEMYCEDVQFSYAAALT